MAEIGLSGLPLDYPDSGTAAYVRNLVSRLPEVAPDLDFCLFLRQAVYPDGSTAVTRLPTTRGLSTPFAALNRGRGLGARLDKLTWEIVSMPLASARRRQVLLHSLYFAAPIHTSAPLVVTIHDLVPLVLPGYHRSRQSALYAQFMARTAKRAVAVVTVSQHSKQDIIRVLGIPEERVHVTMEAVDERFQPRQQPGESEALREKYGLPDRFLLYLGGAEKRKNIETLVRAWRTVVAAMREREVRLVVVADFPPPDPAYPDIPGLSDALGLRQDIVFVRRVQEEDKPALYRSALGLCFPSTYEGFGFTPLEAMACGTPVLASDATSIPEVVGDAGHLLPPTDVGAWAEEMLRLVDSAGERRELGVRGVQRARSFAWTETARQTVSVYRGVLG